MADFHIDVAIVDEGMEIVVVHDIWGYGTNGDVHVTIVARLHWHAKVESLMLPIMQCLPVVEIMLLKRSLLVVMRSVVLVLTLLAYYGHHQQSSRHNGAWLFWG